jgi:NAD(P)-dependent dehydrogenase (short-subunit alcohol dehydrogenase family)
MASIRGKVALVTGATDELGRALAAELARAGATVLVHGSNPGRIADTLRETGATRSYRADLASLAEVRALAGQVLADEARLDILVNNAGIGATVPGGGARQESADGYELRFAVNYLAGFALTRRLLPLLRKAAPSRVINVSSLGQQAIDFSDVMLTAGYDGMRAYRQSKLAQVMFTIDLAAELGLAGVAVNALHPETGIAATMRLVTAPIGETGTGKYFNGPREARADEQAYDPDERRQLRELAEKLTGL